MTLLVGLGTILTAGVIVVVLMGSLELLWGVAARRSNCFWYAMRRWWREGGYVTMRWSAFGPFPHFAHSGDLVRFTEFAPPAKRARRVPPVLFRGQIQESAMGEERKHAKYDKHVKAVAEAAARAGGHPNAKLRAAVHQTCLNARELVDDVLTQFEADFDAHVNDLFAPPK